MNPTRPLQRPNGGDMEACATGVYNGLWEEFGEVLIARDRADSIVRVGWEFNGDQFPPTRTPEEFETVGRTGAMRG